MATLEELKRSAAEAKSKYDEAVSALDAAQKAPEYIARKKAYDEKLAEAETVVTKTRKEYAETAARVNARLHIFDPKEPWKASEEFIARFREQAGLEATDYIQNMPFGGGRRSHHKPLEALRQLAVAVLDRHPEVKAAKAKVDAAVSRYSDVVHAGKGNPNYEVYDLERKVRHAKEDLDFAQNALDNMLAGIAARAESRKASNTVLDDKAREKRLKAAKAILLEMLEGKREFKLE